MFTVEFKRSIMVIVIVMGDGDDGNVEKLLKTIYHVHGSQNVYNQCRHTLYPRHIPIIMIGVIIE